MKRVMASVLVVLSVSAFGSKVSANDYKSVVLAGGTTSLPSPIALSDDQFLVIKSFTQAGDMTTRGVVSISILNGVTLPMPQNVLSASFVPTDTTPVEPVNSIVIAGPATINVSCLDTSATCFVTYRKESN